ncbi:coenzyme F420-0:L-glutamate ligase [Patescibacteria group bacterium]
MKVTALKTPLVKKGDDLLKIISQSLEAVPEKSVLVVTSKIVTVCQGQMVSKIMPKHELVRKEADLYLDPKESIHGMMITVKGHTLAVNAGIDESNANGHFLLLPRNLQKTTNQIWQFLREQYGVKEVGVIVTDSRSFPLRWGVLGTCLSHCGFRALFDRRGEKDLFGREIKETLVNVAEALAVAGVFQMGEVAEQTPLALIKEIGSIKFQDREPSKQELQSLKLTLENDIYGPILTRASWQKGSGGYEETS